MNKSFLLIPVIMLIFTGMLSAVFSMVVFREITDEGTTCKTLQLVMEQNKKYPVGMDKTHKDFGWKVQLYKDGGDGIISPLDKEGNPTGDDIMITDPFHLNTSQPLVFPITRAWQMAGYRFTARDTTGEAFYGDKIYLRIFNHKDIAKADKYIVSHKLYTIPETNDAVNYVPAYGWDKQGWITFRK